MPDSRRLDLRASLAAASLLLLTVVAYVPALDAGFIWDDDAYVEDNRTLRSADGLRRIWFEVEATPQYYPLVHTSYWIEYRLWGLNPTGYHAVNVLLHGFAAILAWRVLLLLGLGGGAWLAAALFAIHPVQVESVAWITERKNVLSGTLYLASLLAYLTFEKLHRDGRRRGPALYVVSLGLFVLALFSKTVTCSLPAAVLLLVWYEHGRVDRGVLRRLVPFFAVGAALAALTVWLEKHRVGAIGESWDLTPAERFLISGRAVWFYAEKLIWPVGLSFNYPRWEIDVSSIGGYLYPLAALACVLALFLLREQSGRGPLTAVLFFGGTLFPALGFFDVYPMRYSFVADHFQYLACLGLFALIAGGLVRGLGRVPTPTRGVGIAVVALWLVALGSLTWSQTRVYLNRETLWRDTLTENPESWLAHANLGGVLQARGRIDEALGHYQQALRIQQGLPGQPDLAQALNNLGGALRDLGRRDEAREHFLRSLEVWPGYHKAQHNLGVMLRQDGRFDDALERFRLSVASKPDYVNGHFNLGNTLAMMERYDEAIVAFRNALALDPGRTDVLDNLHTAEQLRRQAERAD